MMDAELFLHGVVLLSGVVGALGAGYLLYADTITVHYASFFRIIAVGLFVFAASAPIIVEFAPDVIHAVHAFSALCISVGLYTLIRDELQNDEEFEHLRVDSQLDDPQLDDD